MASGTSWPISAPTSAACAWASGEKDLVHNHVLQDFAKAERELAAKVIEAVAAEAPRLIAGDDGGFMSRVAFLLAPPKPKKEKPPETTIGRENQPKQSQKQDE
jgi:PTH1 family peptidyl-tRNA hydrolase